MAWATSLTTVQAASAKGAFKQRRKGGREGLTLLESASVSTHTLHEADKCYKAPHLQFSLLLKASFKPLGLTTLAKLNGVTIRSELLNIKC